MPLAGQLQSGSQHDPDPIAASLTLPPLHLTSQICRLHDDFYCQCDKAYTAKGLEPPNDPLVAMRSLAPFSEVLLPKLDKQYFR